MLMPNKLFINKINQTHFLYLSHFSSNYAFFSVLTILTLYLTRDCGFSLTFASTFMLLVFMFSRAGRIALLPLLKKFTNKSTILMCCVIMAICYLILSYTKQPLLMLALLFAMGIAYGCHSVYIRSLIGSLPHANKLSYVKLSMITNASAAIASLLAAYFYTHISGESVFFSAAILMSCTVMINAYFLKLNHSDSATINLRDVFRFIFNTQGIIHLFILTLCAWILYVQIFTILPLMLDNQLNATKFLGSLYAINTLLILVFSMPINKYLLTLQLKHEQYINIGFIFILFGFLLLYLFPTLLCAYLAMMLWTLGEILVLPTLNSALSETAKGAERLHIFAFNGIAIGIGEGVGMFIGTRLASTVPISHVNRVYLYLAMLAAFFVIMVKWMKSNKTNELSTSENIKECANSS